jgi:RNA polymerase sigma-70 factor (ECF subfamily)
MPTASRPLAELDDAALVDALRQGDEAVLARLMDTYDSALLRVATTHTGSRAAAEEVVQETWLAVIRRLDGFEGRSSLKTWIFTILTNIAARRGERERRTVPFCSLAGEDGRAFDPTGHWTAPPRAWDAPADAALSVEVRELLTSAIAALPPTQRAVISLRDVEGWSAADTCAALGLGAANQRALLHRARAKLRTVLERYQADL